MASQVKIRLSRPQQQRFNKTVQSPTAASSQGPRTAVPNPRAATLRSSSRPSRVRASQLPVPVPNVNKTAAAKHKSKTVNDSSPSTNEQTDLHLDPKASRHATRLSAQQAHLSGDLVAKNLTLPSSDKQQDGLPTRPASTDGSPAMIHSARTPVLQGNKTLLASKSVDVEHLSDNLSNIIQQNSASETVLTQEGSSSTSPNEPPPSQKIMYETSSDELPQLNGDQQNGKASVETQVDLPGSKLPPSSPADPWHSAFSELKTMGIRLAKLDNIERDVAALKDQFKGISDRTKTLEGIIHNHSSDITSMKTSLSELKSSTERYDSAVESLWTYSDDIASKADQRIKEIKQAIQENINKIENIGDIKAEINRAVASQLKEGLQAFKKEIKKEFGEQLRRSAQSTKSEIADIINRNTHDIAYKGLQDQAYYNRHNLVFLGIPAHERDSAFTQALNFCRSNLNLNRLSIDVAYRMGKQPAQDSSYVRPMVAKFSKIADRNTVWGKRNDISQNRRDRPIRIQADIPKQLREDLLILYKVKNAALKCNQFQSVEVKNYRLYLDGSEYAAWELEGLPLALRPSTLATRLSDSTLVFYSKHSILSNHYTAPFEVRGRPFANMEQYLAYRRAKLSGKKPLIQKALQAQDPVEAKSILNTLRSDHYEEWIKDLKNSAMEGLQAKFRQHPALGEYLRNTAPLTLGEASTNQRWGVGMALQDEKVLDKSKWNKQGNLLGRLLMEIRDQMIKERQPSTPAPQPTKKASIQNIPNGNNNTTSSPPNQSTTKATSTLPHNTAPNHSAKTGDTHPKVTNNSTQQT